MERFRKIRSFFRAKRAIQYYDRESYFHSIYSHYNYLENQILNVEKVKDIVITKRRIRFGFDLEFGLRSKQILDKLGNPYFTYSNRSIPEYTIYFFKRKVYKYKMKVEVHFFKDVFFMGIYTFDVSKDEAKAIMEDICTKYQLELGSFFHQKNKIVDQIGNTLDIDFKLNLVVAYIDGNNKEIEQLRNRYNENIKIIERKKTGAFQKFYELL